jgi:flagellar biosynthesis/type III secretory pathway protein FliH
MSSFEALALAAADGGAPGDFVPLCPSGGGGAPEGWRPLFREVRDSEMRRAETGRAGGTAAGGEGGGSGVTAGDDREGREAFAAGYEKGRREVASELEVIAESLVKSLETLGAFRAAIRQRYERELLELALGVARKVLHSELRERPDVWLGMIRDGVRQAVDRDAIRIRVPAALSAFLRERLPALRAQLEDVKELSIVEDASLADGGCVIETGFGEVDLSVDAQVAQVERCLAQDR